MGDAYVGFIPAPLKNMSLPDGYAIEGITDNQGTFYYWYTTPVGVDMEFGDNVSCRTKAYKGAWDHSRRNAP